MREFHIDCAFVSDTETDIIDDDSSNEDETDASDTEFDTFMHWWCESALQVSPPLVLVVTTDLPNILSSHTSVSKSEFHSDIM